MAKGRCQTKVKKSDGTPSLKKPTKSKPADASTDKQTDKQFSLDQVKCLECGCLISDDTRALNCEKCGKLWKCSACVGIRPTTYDDLVSDAGKELHWFCESCHEATINPAWEDRVMETLAKMAQQMSDIEQKLDTKADTARMAAVEEMVKGLETKICVEYNATVKSLEKQMSREMQDIRATVTGELASSDTKDSIVSVEEKVIKLAETVEKQRAASHELRDCVQDAVKEKLQEDKEEMEDIKKRSHNIIIHGLKEVPDEDGEARKKADEDQLEQLLHAIQCDDVSVQNIVRLGKYDGAQGMPRSVKVVTTSEQQRDKVLAQAKNLHGSTTFGRVWIQQDLTVKQRERRRVLVQQLKQRKADGETNLIIVQDKIVVRRQRI